MQIKLPAKQPFSLRSVIHSHGWARLAPFQLLDDGNAISYVMRLTNGATVKLIIRGEPEGVSVEILGAAGQPEVEEISNAVTWMLALDEDFTDFYALAMREPKLHHIEQNAQGRLLRSPTVFEDAVKTILTTNTSWSGTIRMNAALVEHFGTPVPGSTTEFSFPLPEIIAKSDEQTLRETTRLGYRSPYILGLAQAITSGSLNLESLKSSDLAADQLYKRLLSIKGIGSYAAANLMMLLGHYEFLTIDSWARKMVSREFYNGEAIDDREVLSAFESWGKWKGLVYWLWDWTEV